MDFLRNALNTRLSRRRQQKQPPSPSPPSSPAPPAHALDTLPTLPHPRRPLTPTPPHPQPQSPFFTLPAELRLKIYHLLLTSPTPIHLDLRYTAAHTPAPHSTATASLLPSRAWRWSASHCHRHPLSPSALSDCCTTGGAPPTACALYDKPCGIGREVLSLLRACRAAYREAAAVLYATNTFHVGSGALLLYTPRLLPAERAGAVRRAVVSVTEANVWDYAQEHLGIEGGLAAYAALIGRVRLAFPGLVGLEVVVKGALARGRVGGERGELGALDGGEVRGCLLGAMDGVVAGYGGRLGEDCVLTMGVEAFDRVMEGELAGAERVELREGVWLQFWRPVRVARGEGTVVETGYWVRRVFPDERAGPLDSIEAALSEYLNGLTLTYAGDGSPVLVGVSTAAPSATPPHT